MTVAELKAVIKTVMDEQSVSKVKNEASSISDWIKKAIGFAGICKEFPFRVQQHCCRS